MSRDADDRGRLARLLKALGPLFMLAVLVTILMVAIALHPHATLTRFGGLDNIRTVLVQTVIVAICACGMTMVIVSGGLDLSVGSSIALCSVAAALTITATGSIAAGVGVAVLTGATVGATNGLLVAGLRMNPFIVTLGMMGVARGLAKILSGGRNVYPFLQFKTKAQDTVWLERFLAPESDWFLGLAPGIYLGVIVMILMVVIMRRTVFGRRVYALGSNEDAARLCGIRVGRNKWLIYVFAGALFGLGAVLEVGRQGAGDPTMSEGFELVVIAAVVLGGASLSGGAGTIVGSVLGACIMTVLRNGLTHLEVSDAWQLFVIGAIIVFAVALDQVRRGAYPGLARAWHRLIRRGDGDTGVRG